MLVLSHLVSVLLLSLRLLLHLMKFRLLSQSQVSLNGSRPSRFIGRNVKVGAAKCPDPEFIENGVLGTGQAERI